MAKTVVPTHLNENGVKCISDDLGFDIIVTGMNDDQIKDLYQKCNVVSGGIEEWGNDFSKCSGGTKIGLPMVGFPIQAIFGLMILCLMAYIIASLLCSTLFLLYGTPAPEILNNGIYHWMITH